MTVIGILLLVVGLLVGAALTLADPVLLSRIIGERAGGVAEGGSGTVVRAPQRGEGGAVVRAPQRSPL
jgi:hypothetical protein